MEIKRYNAWTIGSDFVYKHMCCSFNDKVNRIVLYLKVYCSIGNDDTGKTYLEYVLKVRRYLNFALYFVYF